MQVKEVFIDVLLQYTDSFSSCKTVTYNEMTPSQSQFAKENTQNDNHIYDL